MFRKAYATLAVLALSVSITTTPASALPDSSHSGENASASHFIEWVASIVDDLLGEEAPTSQADGDGEDGTDVGTYIDPDG